MKKSIVILLSVSIMFFLLGCSLKDESKTDIQEKPDPKEIDFEGLETSQVKRVYIVFPWSFYGAAPTKWAELTYDDMDSLVALLNQVELTGEPSDKFTDATGTDWHMYRIELYNGQEFDFANDNRYYVIDMNGYDADADVGSELRSQYYDWTKKYFPDDYS